MCIRDRARAMRPRCWGPSSPSNCGSARSGFQLSVRDFIASSVRDFIASIGSVWLCLMAHLSAGGWLLGVGTQGEQVLEQRPVVDHRQAKLLGRGASTGAL